MSPGHFATIQYPLSIVPCYPITLGIPAAFHIILGVPSGSLKPLGAFPSGFQQNRGHFHPFPLKHCIEFYIYTNMEDALKSFENPQRLIS